MSGGLNPGERERARIGGRGPVLALGFVALLAFMCGCATGVSDGGFGHAPGGGAGPGAPPGGAAGHADSGTLPLDSGPSTQTATDSGGLLDAAPAVDAGVSVDAAVAADTTPVLDAPTVADATTVDTSLVDAVTPLETGTNDGGATGLDPLLDLPDPAGAPCSTPGSEVQCPSIEVCRIDSASGGRCEGCTSCNNLGKACSQSSDCDILFQCYAGVCANICPLGTQYCGAVTDCLDVGNATYGVCRPQ